MQNKYLEKRILINQNEIPDGYNESMQLEYYLIESEIVDDCDMNGKKAFGIEIVKISDGRNIEKQSVSNFSCCKAAARDTIIKLASNIVTPCSLHFILDDLIGA